MLPNEQAYLADVLDSAQEAYPFMWVNGEKYFFSEHVITKGIDLYQKFQEIATSLPKVRSLPQLYAVKSLMMAFDAYWCLYEQAYIGELMVIERDARRFIYDLTDSVEDTASFVRAIGQLNSVAN